MDSNHDMPALQSLMDFAPRDDKRLATDHASVMQSEASTAAVATDRPSTPPDQQQNSETQPRSILKRRSSDFLHSAGERDSPTATENRRKVRFSSVDAHYEMVDEDRPRRSSTASPPPPNNKEDLPSDEDEADHHYHDGDDEDEEISDAATENEVATQKADADIGSASPPTARDSEGYDPNADVDPPSPSPIVESQSTSYRTSNQADSLLGGPTSMHKAHRAEDAHETGRATTATPSGGVTVVGKFNFDRFRGTFSSSDVRVLDSEGYDPDADIDPPSDGEQDDVADRAPGQTPMKIFTAGPTALPPTIMTTSPTTPRGDAPSVPAPTTQPAKATPSTPASAAASVGEATKALAKPLAASPPFHHTRETDDMIRRLRSSSQPFSAIADRVNEIFASRGLAGKIDGNGVYSRLVVLNHIDGTSDENASRDRANGGQSALFATLRADGPRGANVRESGRKRTTFSAKDDELLLRIHEERSRRFWDDVALDMEKETGRKFDKTELEERFAAI